jgi:hypothetical protein
MGFKMKGPSLYPNFKKGRQALYGVENPGNISGQQKDYKGTADGRATSSPFQMSEKETLSVKKGSAADKKSKVKRNQWGETPEEYRKRMEEMGLRKSDKKAPPTKMTGDKKKKKTKTKEDYIKEGFTPADADRMKRDGATTGRVSQENWQPAYPGADYSKTDIAKMTEKEKIAKIDGYTPKTKKTKK